MVKPSATRSLVRRAVLAYSVRNRRRKAAIVLSHIEEQRLETVLFVGTGGDRNPNELVLERAVAGSMTVVAACDLYPARPEKWPYVQGDGRCLPFRSGAVDLVLSNAVIEHVGGEADQRAFVEEHRRVGDSWVITTPNRWFPVESHTSALLRHWWPGWRAQRREFTRLLSLREFRDLLPPDAVVVGRPWSPTFTATWSKP